MASANMYEFSHDSVSSARGLPPILHSELQRLGLKQGLLTEGLIMLGLLLLIVLVLLVVGALPTWGYSREWGYAPSGGLGLVLVIILVLAVLGYLPLWGQ